MDNNFTNLNVDQSSSRDLRPISYPEQLSVFYRDVDGFFTATSEIGKRSQIMPAHKEFFMVPPRTTQLYQQSIRR